MLNQKNIRIFFSFLFIVSVIYVLFIESERYQSSSSILVKDLSSTQAAGLDLSIFGATGSSQMQDSKVLEAYLKSPELLDEIDKHFSLKEYYLSDKLDFLNRLWKDSTKEDFLEKYLQNLSIHYDELSGILIISFLHTDSAISKAILEFVLKKAEEQINIYNQRNANKYLNFVKESLKVNKGSLNDSINSLEKYQNKNLVLDPTSTAETTSGIIATLEAELVKKTAMLEQLKQYMSENSFDIKNLKNEIKGIRNSISNSKSKLSGDKNNRLNVVLFEFERLKNQVEFEKEKYKQTLVQYEIAKNDVEKDAKTLQIVVKPNLPEGHSIPDRPMSILNIIIALGLLFGIVSLVVAIIKDHRD